MFDFPDVGEGVAEAELVSWHVEVGQEVTSDSVVAEVLTDKATVEVYAPVAGRVEALNGQAGDVLAVGSEFFVIDTDASAAPATDQVTPSAGHSSDSGESASERDPEPTDELVAPISPDPAPSSLPGVAAEQAPEAPPDVPGVSNATRWRPSNPAAMRPAGDPSSAAKRADQDRGTAAPAVRQRARQLGIDLGAIIGTGPDGHVTHEDLDRIAARPPAGSPRPTPGVTSETPTTVVPLIGLRRRIAERLSIASSRIPHITYVEEVDMTQLEQLRHTLTNSHPAQPRLTVLPFLIAAVVRAVADQPQLNATIRR